MRRYKAISVAFVVAAGVVCAGGWALQTLQRQPSLALTFSTIDLGRQAPRSRIVKELDIGNAGGGELRVIELKASCGCTSVHATRSTLAQGETAKLVATIAVPGRTGPFAVKLAVITNDPARPVREITFQLDVAAEIISEPAFIDFGTISRSDLPTSKSTRVFVSQHFPEARIESVQSRGESVVVAVPTAGTEYGASRVSVTIPPDAPIGPIVGRVEIQHGMSGDRKLTEIPVTGYVRGPIFARPDSVILGAKPGMRSQVELASIDPQARYRITSVMPSREISDLVECTVSESNVITISIKSYDGSGTVTTKSDINAGVKGVIIANLGQVDGNATRSDADRLRLQVPVIVSR